MMTRETTLIPVDMVPDWNRDGRIDAADRGKVSPANPWRFWINDYDDSGETEGTDISQEYDINAPPNYDDHQVNGVRDFVDYFPLHFDLRAVLKVFPNPNIAMCSLTRRIKFPFVITNSRLLLFSARSILAGSRCPF